jgi:2-methylcitrate dehydratase PrpD
VEAAAKVALMDTLGCALAGFPEDAARIAREQVADLGAKPVATVWGSSLRSAPAEAAFANAVATHVLDFDDTLATLRGHASATTLPVAHARGEQVGASGTAVLRA